MHFLYKISSFVLIVSILSLSCTEKDIITPPSDIPTQNQQSPYDFGIDMWNAIEIESGENKVISPLSILTAMHMLANGTLGEAKEEVLRGLLFENASLSGANETHEKLAEDIARSNSNSAFVNLANAVFWDNNCIEIDAQFRQTLEESFQAEFLADAFTKEKINAWVSENTNEKIKEVIDVIQDDEIMFLINALYMEASWNLGFDSLLTHEEIFSSHDGTTSVDMMHSDTDRNYLINDTLSAVELSFKGNEYSMLCMLRHDGSSQSLFTDLLNKESQFASLLNQLNENRLLLSLPKFEVKYRKLLKDALKSMGITEIWEEGNGDLSGLGNSLCGPMYVSRVIHETFLKVDEQGVEGAAVTVVGVGVESVPPVIEFNRPFEFVIYHKETLAPVFMGYIQDFQ